MNTIEIYNLLLEASNLQSIKTRDSVRRRNEIQILLKSQCKPFSKKLTTLFNSLYVNTLQNTPSLLPKLLPVFALLCGDRCDNKMLGEVDWEFINKELIN